MESKNKRENLPSPPHIIEQMKKREILINIFYKSGRPIFNYVHDKTHIFIETEENKILGGYY
jgi:hypothetical protein